MNTIFAKCGAKLNNVFESTKKTRFFYDTNLKKGAYPVEICTF